MTFTTRSAVITPRNALIIHIHLRSKNHCSDRSSDLVGAATDTGKNIFCKWLQSSSVVFIWFSEHTETSSSRFLAWVMSFIWYGTLVHFFCISLHALIATRLDSSPLKDTELRQYSRVYVRSTRRLAVPSAWLCWGPTSHTDVTIQLHKIRLQSHDTLNQGVAVKNTTEAICVDLDLKKKCNLII